MTGGRVLLADDLAPVLNAVAKLVGKSFDVVATVSDGRSALATILELSPDLAVLDISMPGLSGIEVARELKRRGTKVRIVFLTVHEDADILAACLEAGAQGYVVKVLMETDLIPAMQAALDGREFVSHFCSQPEPPNGR